MTGAPRPAAPDDLYTLFTKHTATCAGCRDGMQCPYGEHLMEAWGYADWFYANEQAMIDAVLTQDSEPKEESHA